MHEEDDHGAGIGRERMSDNRGSSGRIGRNGGRREVRRIDESDDAR